MVDPAPRVRTFEELYAEIARFPDGMTALAGPRPDVQHAVLEDLPAIAGPPAPASRRCPASTPT